MDLRTKKTEKAIRSAFIELRKKHSLGKVKIKDICEIAMINKTTFYRHYRDVFELSDILDKEIVEYCFNAIMEKGDMLHTPKKLIKDLPDIFSKYGDILLTLFSDRTEDFFKMLSEKFRSFYRTNGSSKEEEVLCMFLMGGLNYTISELKKEEDLDEHKVLKYIFKILDRFEE